MCLYFTEEANAPPHDEHLYIEIDHDGVLQWNQDVDIHEGHYSSNGTICDEEDVLLDVDVESGSDTRNNPYIGFLKAWLQSSNNEPMYGLVYPAGHWGVGVTGESDIQIDHGDSTWEGNGWGYCPSLSLFRGPTNSFF
jgi:hypothetical protein